MIQIRRQAIVRRTPEQMFDLVNDVEAYPSRFGWCAASRVLERAEQSLVARLDLRLAGFTQSFTTRNTFERAQRLHMQLVDGPLRTLDGEWSFVALGEIGCKIALALDFDYAGKLMGPALRLGFQGLATRMVDDFVLAASKLDG
ncbi:MAG: type II toxin-antitoxin system RatA family toxin [Dokdonella sp.]|uniref:type II toxin-antitoxin system RatA family toxin n=1 Tax=Dokdonella sp. TaxID=2291710 RepID=UPI0025C09204|nr:type II toxin-antitoxin system RatA family toxin [Dokdonella sp.]MBZ0221527.1 type II toxin-antitoxin system RatA family toxin [Dokdonella sp.]